MTKMEIKEVQFVQSSPGLKGMPDFDLPEFAFIGRSNVGKSSLINMLCDRKSIAKVSGTPGKTRLINLFRVSSQQSAVGSQQSTVHSPQLSIINYPLSIIPHLPSPISSWYLVDLPGYGWAKLSKVQREKFEGVIQTYLAKRENLACTFLLIDSRLPAQRIDVEFMNWLGDQEISFIILFTKTDKLSKTQLAANLSAYRNELSKHWEEIPAIIPVSSVTRQGKSEVLGSIQKMLEELRIRN